MKEKINLAFTYMIEEIAANRAAILEANRVDVELCDRNDVSLYDRLAINDAKVDGMISSLRKVLAKDFPFHQSLYTFTHENGIKIENKTVPFGTILIIYESRPDVTVEATSIALKSGNKILLKGGKEARKSNLILAACWERALDRAGLETDRVRYLDLNRTELQAFLEAPDTTLDLIIPRGGERLIEYVQSVATCPVLVSGRGNNFLYVAPSADLEMAKSLIVQSKINKISACNALDKVLIDAAVPSTFRDEVEAALVGAGVELIQERSDAVWQEEFLDMKIVVDVADGFESAVKLINQHSGGHSVTIVTEDEEEANRFMEVIDAAAVYHNASTRFTDGFQFGLGAEMAISTEKLHHRGPLGIEHLVTNKWYIKGNGQIR